MPLGIYGLTSVACTCGNEGWRRHYTWLRGAPQSSSWPKPSPGRAQKIPLSWITPAQRASRSWKNGACLDVYVRSGTTTRATLALGQ